MQSKKYSINKTDLIKIGKGALIAVGGAAAVYLLEVLPDVEFGQYTPIIVAICSILLNAVLKYTSGK